MQLSMPAMRHEVNTPGYVSGYPSATWQVLILSR
jgi:hypothetical protein